MKRRIELTDCFILARRSPGEYPWRVRIVTKPEDPRYTEHLKKTNELAQAFWDHTRMFPSPAIVNLGNDRFVLAFRNKDAIPEVLKALFPVYWD